MDIKTFQQLQDEFDKVLLLKDRGVLRILCATVVGNRLSLDPVWLFLVAGPSSGKSEFLESLNGLQFIHPISTLTVNTFASGQKRDGIETSLIYKLKNGIMVFKDFTSIISKQKEAMQEIMGQLREIYDGSFVKETGTGHRIAWKGRVGLIAGITTIIDYESNSFASMGERFIQYKIITPDRIEALRKAWDNAFDMKEKRERLKDCMASYITHVLDNMNEERVMLSEEVKENIFEISNFTAIARSGVKLDFRTGKVTFVPEKEMPMRIAKQLYCIACGISMLDSVEPMVKTINENQQKGDLSLDDVSLLYKIALDSIPTQRRLTLINLAKYKGGVTTAGLAVKLRYPTETVNGWLSQINALGFCERLKGGKEDIWRLKEEFRGTIQKFERVKSVDDELNENVAEEIDNLKVDLRDDEFDAEVQLLFEAKQQEELLKKQEEDKLNND